MLMGKILGHQSIARPTSIGTSIVSGMRFQIGQRAYERKMIAQIRGAGVII